MTKGRRGDGGELLHLDAGALGQLPLLVKGLSVRFFCDICTFWNAEYHQFGNLEQKIEPKKNLDPNIHNI